MHALQKNNLDKVNGGVKGAFIKMDKNERVNLKRSCCMNWKDARKKIMESLKVNAKSIDPNSHFRDVRTILDDGYLIGKGENQTVRITWNMLETLFKDSKKQGNYDNLVFKKRFEDELSSASCYVHIVGHVFCVSGVMAPEGKRKFRLLD